MGAAARQILECLHPLQHHLALGAPNQLTALGGIYEPETRDTLDALAITARYTGGTTVVVTSNPAVQTVGDITIRGPWPALHLEFPPTPSTESGYDLTRFGRDLAGTCTETRGQLEAACTTHRLLCQAVDQIRSC